MGNWQTPRWNQKAKREYFEKIESESPHWRNWRIWKKKQDWRLKKFRRKIKIGFRRKPYSETVEKVSDFRRQKSRRKKVRKQVGKKDHTRPTWPHPIPLHPTPSHPVPHLTHTLKPNILLIFSVSYFKRSERAPEKLRPLKYLNLKKFPEVSELGSGMAEFRISKKICNFFWIWRKHLVQRPRLDTLRALIVSWDKLKN